MIFHFICRFGMDRDAPKLRGEALWTLERSMPGLFGYGFRPKLLGA